MKIIVSILLPTYKNPPHIACAIESVRAQTFEGWELVIIDDGLDECTKSIVDEYVRIDSRIRSIKNQSNVGIQRSLNTGLATAQGEYIARIDDDDEWIDADKLKKQVAYFDANKDCVLLGTNGIIVDEDGRRIASYELPRSDTAIRSRMLLKNCFLHSSIMARAGAIKSAGGYPETVQSKHIEDYALWLILGSKGTFANLADTTVAIMVHTASLTAQNRVVQVKRMRNHIKLYKNVYPHDMLGYSMPPFRTRLFNWIPTPLKRFVPFLNK